MVLYINEDHQYLRDLPNADAHIDPLEVFHGALEPFQSEIVPEKSYEDAHST